MDRGSLNSNVGPADRSLPRQLAPAAIAGALALVAYDFSGNFQAGIAVLICGLLASALVQRRALQRQRGHQHALIAAFEALGRGDTAARLRPAGLGELAGLAGSFNAMAELLGASAERVATLTRGMVELPRECAGAIADVNRGAEDQEGAVEEASALLANINSSIRGINREIVQLARSNEETASSIMEMGSAIEQVASGAATLRDTVESSTSSVHELNAQIRRVAESGDSVQEAAEETASSINQMDQAIREVGDHVRSASELTEQVSESAEEGARAVGETIEGIAQIRDLTRDAKTALEGLADRIGTIGEIASVINGISDETNLLSLNAAIIAAQAGEHGRAFAVVAEQVKTLARRTTQSTKEIESLIRAVQQQSENAVQAMGAGIDAVEQGVTRSRGAGAALERIRDSARDASGRVAEIARAAEEQGRNSRYVSESARRTSEQVHQISGALTEQSLATEQLLKNSTESLEMCRQMSSATEEQRASSQYISSNITAITDLIRGIQTKTASHEQASQGVAESVASILENARRSSERIPEVARAVVALRDQAEAIEAELGHVEREGDSGAESGPRPPSIATHTPA